MSDTKHTAVEWLIHKLSTIDTRSMADVLSVHKQALAMEREQIIEAYTECWFNDGGNADHKKQEAEQYYTDTYGK